MLQTRLLIWFIAAGVLIAGISAAVSYLIFPKAKLGYVNSSKLFLGYWEAAKVDKELKAEEDKYKKQLLDLQDSINAKVNLMTKEYDKASAQRKRELEDMLAAANQKANNFKHGIGIKMDELRAQKMKPIIDKVNIYISEFGKTNHFSIIFATTAAGNIVYANDGYDLTGDIIKGLNERYK